ncbi:Pycsar system effector family protein [Leeuwenhoekiella palythoae]|uniref:HD domain-containing protein n=1 Tax=Leeuwenhoekiella palythoae TaxID=573501 RepID=A0A1M5TFG6_9FLAO|nr:Pycsar system effector family protein [Leeuwenhoekiella palythoae]MAS19901.1 HD domain-containing protein [Leeuwenhoekiella sp.]MEC7783802.1 Pycsar system effector family protein [Bacteroidota bacterium]MBH12431.1 HD domain-containing protein [Leeuwenhoekiella sp.]MBH13528.1 HD domain-containing protein [Leeuwenhoekiella sp.]MEC8884662.1 Pycsar system effector family protein [Bacteroidota bacterium]|tara:strand:- start:1055 stop:2260 length:1206 start_codon:yes stop_codon:yes gene_type:complete
MAETAEKPIKSFSKADQFVLELFKEKLPNSYLYHNYNHTVRVVKSTKEIIENSQINVKQKEALILAAWMHDTGYTVTRDGHEEASIDIAKEYMTKEGVDAETQKLVVELIASTKMGVEPKNELECILKDADNSHFAKEYYAQTSEFLRQELLLTETKKFTPAEWREENIQMFTHKHKFYTDYAARNWKNQKDENLISLLKKEKKKKKKYRKEEVKAKLKAKFKDESPDRGVQTLYRTTLRNHIKLSDIADTKANILLSVNAIIISLALSNMIPKLDAPSNRHLLIPTLILVVFSVASIIMSILSTRPNVTSGEFTREQVKKKQVNILFFGNFHKMKYDQYQWAINEIIYDKDYIYEALTKDLYLLGVVLNKKYLLLRKTYTVFMVGIIVSVISFIIAFWLI